jgi:hypothetical protein
LSSICTIYVHIAHIGPFVILQTNLLSDGLHQQITDCRKKISLTAWGCAGKSKRRLTAPAGYGKTMLVNSWLETLDEANAWLSLDESDNNLEIFVAYLAVAVRR